MENLLAWGLTTLVGAFVGSYLSSYLKKKGENLATHEDIGKLVDQMKAVTQATKEIEAKISGELWNKQKLWELKREVLFDTAKAVGNTTRALIGLYGLYISFPAGEKIQMEAAAQTVWADALGDLYGAATMVGLVCGPDVKAALRDFHMYAAELAREIVNNPKVFIDSSVTLAEKLGEITTEMRREIAIDTPAYPSIQCIFGRSNP